MQAPATRLAGAAAGPTDPTPPFVSQRTQPGPLLFGVILIHELSHCTAARALGGEATEILLWPLGGIAFIGGNGQMASGAGLFSSAPAPAPPAAATGSGGPHPHRGHGSGTSLILCVAAAALNRPR